MGCDIHLMAEKKVYHYEDKERANGVWINIDKWSENEGHYEYNEKRKMAILYEDRFYTGRNYNLFCALAGVRRNAFYGEPKIISEPKGRPKDASKLVKSEIRSWGSDGHSHSYLTLKELKDFDWADYGNTCDEFVNKTIPKLETFKGNGTTDDEIRVVFFF
jgi:hypothetical protein